MNDYMRHIDYRVEVSDRMAEVRKSARGKDLAARIVRLGRRGLKMRDTGGFPRYSAYAAIAAIDPSQLETIIGAYNEMVGFLNDFHSHPVRVERKESVEPTEIEALLLLAELLGLMRIVPGLRFFPHNEDKEQ